MKILRTTGNVKNLYFVSPIPILDKKLQKPEVPDNFLTREKVVNWQVPRIRFYDSIDDALSGIFLGQEIGGSKLYVYRPLDVRYENLLGVGLTDAPYTLYFKEWWYTFPIKLELLGEIEVGEKLSTKKYRYGSRSKLANVYTWDWEEILQPWQRSKLKKK